MTVRELINRLLDEDMNAQVVAPVYVNGVKEYGQVLAPHPGLIERVVEQANAAITESLGDPLNVRAVLAGKRDREVVLELVAAQPTTFRRTTRVRALLR